MSSSAETRRTEILDVLVNEHYLRIADLSHRFGVSQMSIRRDLCQLEEQGLLRRVHGGLISTPLLRLGLEVSPQIVALIQDSWLEKEAIARAAAALVTPGDHLIFDSGILSYLTACALPGDLLTAGELTVITNSLLVALELAPWQGVETIMLGGEYQAKSLMNLSGPGALLGLQGLHADKMFMTVEAIDIPHGLTSSSNDVALLDKMISACASLILLATVSAIGKTEQQPILALSSVHTLVTGEAAPAEFVSSLREQGINVVLTKPGLRKIECP